MTVCLVILGYLILKVEDVNLFAKGGQVVTAAFDSVVGLDDKAAVRIAGVRVGRVDGIDLLGRQGAGRAAAGPAADAHRRHRGRRSRTWACWATSTSRSRRGRATRRRSPPTRCSRAPRRCRFDDAMAKLNDVGESIQDITGSLSGEGGETSVSAADLQPRGDCRRASRLVAANKAQVSGTVGNFERFSGDPRRRAAALTQQIERVLSQVDTVLAENREQPQGQHGERPRGHRSASRPRSTT